MRTTLCRLALPVCLTVSCVLLSGCEDAASREATQTSETLSAQRAAISRVANAGVLPGAEEFDGMREALVAAASALDGVRAGTDGQQASAQLLASNAHRQIAQMDLADARLVGESISRATHEIFQQLDAYGRTSQAAASMQAFSENLSRDHLDRERANWGARLRNAEERILLLTEPIDNLEASNDEESDRVRSLRDEANNLLRRAKEMGQIDGQATFENSVARRRDADRIEHNIANAEAELEYDLEPQKAWADLQAEGAQSIIATIDQAKREFDALESELQSRVVSDARAAAQEMRDAIRSRQTELKALVDSRFQPSIDSAVEQADRAISKAGAASSARGSDSNTAKVAKAQAQALKGEALWVKARILGNQMKLLQSMLDAGNIAANANTLQGEVSQLRTAWESAIADAKTAYNEAQTTLQGVGGNTSAAVSTLDQTIGLTLRAIDGEAVDFSEIKTTPQGGSRGASPARGAAPDASGSGLASFDGVVGVLRGFNPTDYHSVVHMMNAVDTSDREFRSYTRAYGEFVNAIDDLMVAMLKVDSSGTVQREFKSAFASVDPNQSIFESVEVLEQGDSKGVVRVVDRATGEVEDVDIIQKRNGIWKIDPTADMSSVVNRSDRRNIDSLNEVTEGLRSIIDRVGTGDIADAREMMLSVGAVFMNAGFTG